MSWRADAGVEDSDCDSCLALCREALEALLSAVPAPNIDAVHALLPNGEAEAGCIIHPIWDLPPGRPGKAKRYVYIWHCCSCGKAGIGIMVDACPDCGVSRCPYCRTEKVRV